MWNELTKNILTYIVQYVFVYLFQSLVYVLGIYAFNKKKVDFKRYALCVIIVMISVSITRRLPINAGVHTFLSLIILVIVSLATLKTKLYPTIKAALFSSVIILIFEVISIQILQGIYGVEEFKILMTENALVNFSIGAVQNIPFFLITFFVYKYWTKPVIKE